MFFVSSEYASAAHVAVFAVDADDSGWTLRFVRGVGQGRLLAAIEPERCHFGWLDVDFERAPDELAREFRKRLLRVFDEEPFAAAFATDAADRDVVLDYRAAGIFDAPEGGAEPGDGRIDASRPLGIYLVEMEQAELVAALSDFQLLNLAAVAFADIESVNVSGDGEEIALAEICAHSSVGLFLGPGPAATALSVDLATTRSSHGPGGRADAECYFNPGDEPARWWIVPLSLRQEWAGAVPEALAPARLLERFADTADTADDADEAAACGLAEEAGKILQPGAARRAGGEVSTWLWKTLSPVLDDPFVVRSRDLLYLEALKAPMSFAGCDEARLGALVEWAVRLDREAAPDEQRCFVTDDNDEFGSFIVTFGEKAVQRIEIAGAYLGQPAAVMNWAPLTLRMRAVLQEVLAFASPRGVAIEIYRGNRESSAHWGPARRIWHFGEAASSSHELMEAIAGLSSFLEERGYGEAEIAGLLAPAEIDRRRPTRGLWL